MNSIKIPLLCVNCNYPDKDFPGTIIEAEIFYDDNANIIEKQWKCPNCKAEHSIKFSVKGIKEKQKSIFSIFGEKKESKKGYEDLVPGTGVQKMED